VSELDEGLRVSASVLLLFRSIATGLGRPKLVGGGRLAGAASLKFFTPGGLSGLLQVKGTMEVERSPQG